MAKIAIMGFGTVGSGVLEVCRRNAASIARRAGEPVEVKYILDVRDFSDSPDAALFVKDINVILNDPEVKVVVETIGGTRFAYPYVRQCLESGRSVCTSNKEMVATYGAELLALAREHKAAFLFEASVGGGTPIITPMHQCLAANQISQIQGIVNGTTNFMLTKMKRESMGFDAALQGVRGDGLAQVGFLIPAAHALVHSFVQIAVDMHILAHSSLQSTGSTLPILLACNWPMRWKGICVAAAALAVSASAASITPSE